MPNGPPRFGGVLIDPVPEPDRFLVGQEPLEGNSIRIIPFDPMVVYLFFGDELEGWLEDMGEQAQVGINADLAGPTGEAAGKMYTSSDGSLVHF